MKNLVLEQAKDEQPREKIQKLWNANVAAAVRKMALRDWHLRLSMEEAEAVRRVFFAVEEIFM